VSEYYTPNMGFIMLITVVAVIAIILAVILVREWGKHRSRKEV
jgi:hypothetical protein